MKRAGLVAILTGAALLLLMRALSPAQLVRSPAPSQRAEGVAASVVRSSRIFTLADGLTAYRLTPYYTTTIGGIDWAAWIENRPFGQYGRELPYHPGFHYVTVAPIVEISPTGRWDSIGAGLSSIVTETVAWQNTLTQTGLVTFTIGDGLVITRPVFASGEIITMVLTRSISAAPVDGVISVTRYISQSGHVVPGTISATLKMMFEVQDDARGLTLNYQGLTGTLVIAQEQDPVFYSAAINVADYGRAQFQVQARTVATDTEIIWWAQFAPAMNGRCEGAVDWSDGAASQWAYRDPDRGAYIWLPMYMLGKTFGADPVGFQAVLANDCARVAFTGPAGVVFTPTIYVRPY